MSAVTPTILCAGKPLDPLAQLLSIEVQHQVDRIPWAELELVDGDASQQTFAWSNSPLFEPGQEVEIQLRVEGGAPSQTVFKGLVERHAIASTGEGSVLRVGLRDVARRLTAGRHSQVFRDRADHQVIGDLITAAGLTQGTLVATEPQHAELVQYDCTDWDFMLSRAEAQGLVLVVRDGTVSLAQVDLAADPKHQLIWGVSPIYDFEMAADGGRQPGAVEGVGWSLPEVALSAPAKATPFDLAQGNLDGAAIAKTLGFDTAQLHHPVPVDPKELSAWVGGRLARNRLSMLRGRLAIPGTATIELLEGLDLQGIGERFNGVTFVSGVRHRVDSRGWRTDLQFGLAPERLCERAAVLEAPAAGLVPAVGGLQIGVVADFAEDPTHELRLKVLLPGVDAKEGVVWARLASPAAGAERGFIFRPEPGDEVVVGFLDQDPRHPIVLGAFHGSRNKPPEPFATPSAENPHKGLVSGKGSTLAFIDNDPPSISLATPAENTLVLDDAAESLRLADQHGNTITLDANGITLESAKDLEIRAQGNVAIQGAKVDVA